MGAFKHYPTIPVAAECLNAFSIFCNAHDAAESFLDAFGTVRKARSAKGTTTDEEQDLLRAALVFAAAGLDSMQKQLIRDALPAVIEAQPGAELQFKQFVERRLGAETKDAYGLLADAIADGNPRARLIEALISELTAGSLQSHEGILRSGSFFDIPSAELVSDVNRLREIFRARNQIVHEMDVNFDHVNRNRRSRTKKDLTGMVEDIFLVANRLLTAVDKRCS